MKVYVAGSRSGKSTVMIYNDLIVRLKGALGPVGPDRNRPRGIEATASASRLPITQQIDERRQDKAFALRLQHRLSVDKPVLDYLERIEEQPEDDFERLAKQAQKAESSPIQNPRPSR